MSFWAENPELYTQIIFNEMVRRGHCNEDDDIEEAVENFQNHPEFTETALAAEREYWSSRIDEAKNLRKERLCKK